jgi:hypothetical protein
MIFQFVKSCVSAAACAPKTRCAKSGKIGDMEYDSIFRTRLEIWIQDPNQLTRAEPLIGSVGSKRKEHNVRKQVLAMKLKRIGCNWIALTGGYPILSI